MTNRASGLMVRGLLAAGALVAIALLVQTVLTYRYVSNNLIQQEARRTALERVRNLERAVRLARPESLQALQAIVDDLQTETSEQLAGIALVQPDGTVVAAAGDVPPAVPAGDGPRTAALRNDGLIAERRAGREVLVGVFPCRCGVPREEGRGAGTPLPAGRLLVEIALFRDSLSAPFGRIRRNAAISASAALTLLAALAIMALRFGPYVRGQQLESQMELARQVQRDLLPASSTQLDGIDAAAECLPAWQVGGDFYDIVTLPGGRVAFVLGDVSGHGISAALLMGLIHGAMSAPPWGAADEPPNRAAARLNELLLKKSSGSRFASLFWCAYGPASHVLQYVNAGHLPGLLFRTSAGTRAIERLAEGGPVLGLLEDATYPAVSVTANAGDLLVLFSDGLVEATNGRAEYFGEERLIAAVKQSLTPARPARAICDSIVDAVRQFAGGRAAADDQTLLVVRL